MNDEKEVTEQEFLVNDADLGKDWIVSGANDIDLTLDDIKKYNDKYGFNIYDENEKLPPSLMAKKINIKYSRIMSPLTYGAEQMLKGYIINDYYKKHQKDFNRENVTFNVVNSVKKDMDAYFKFSDIPKSKTNGHSLEALIMYIRRNIDADFLNELSENFKDLRNFDMYFISDYSDMSTRKADKFSRVKNCMRDYRNGFIDYRYLFDKSSSLGQHIDSARIIYFCDAIRKTIVDKIYNDEIVNSVKQTDSSQYYYDAITHMHDKLKTQKLIDIREDADISKLSDFYRNAKLLSASLALSTDEWLKDNSTALVRYAGKEYTFKDYISMQKDKIVNNLSDDVEDKELEANKRAKCDIAIYIAKNYPDYIQILQQEINANDSSKDVVMDDKGFKLVDKKLNINNSNASQSKIAFNDEFDIPSFGNNESINTDSTSKHM